MKKKIKVPATQAASTDLKKKFTKPLASEDSKEFVETTDRLPNENESIAMDSLSRDPSDPPSHRGSQVRDLDGSDEDENTARLVSGGVEEADSEQMEAARQKRET